MNEKDRQILGLLEENSRLRPEQIATMLGMDEAEVAARVGELEENKIIVKYHTLINWEKAGDEAVSALIEVKVTPQRDVGFQAVAERIGRFPEVKTLHLMSGTYDLAVFIDGKSMRDVSNFVATKLATIDGVVSTTTHFVLKTYKQDGVIVEDDEDDRRLVVSP